MKEKTADEIMLDMFGNIQLTTAGINYKCFKDLIKYLEKISPQHYIIFCQNHIEKEIKKIAKYYQIEYRATELLPQDILILIADKEEIYPGFKKMEESIYE